MAVIVEKNQPRAPADKPPFGAQTGRRRHILKLSLAVVVIKAGRLILKMRLKDVEMPVEIVVPNPHAHAAQNPSVAAQRDTPQQRLLPKSSVVVVQQQIARSRVTGHKKVGPSVLVRVQRDGSESVRTGDARDP